MRLPRYRTMPWMLVILLVSGLGAGACSSGFCPHGAAPLKSRRARRDPVSTSPTPKMTETAGPSVPGITPAHSSAPNDDDAPVDPNGPGTPQSPNGVEAPAPVPGSPNDVINSPNVVIGSPNDVVTGPSEPNAPSTPGGGSTNTDGTPSTPGEELGNPNAPGRPEEPGNPNAPGRPEEPWQRAGPSRRTGQHERAGPSRRTRQSVTRRAVPRPEPGNPNAPYGDVPKACRATPNGPTNPNGPRQPERPDQPKRPDQPERPGARRQHQSQWHAAARRNDTPDAARKVPPGLVGARAPSALRRPIHHASGTRCQLGGCLPRRRHGCSEARPAQLTSR